MTTTTAKTAAEIQIGDRIKFGKDDFRTVIGFQTMEWGATWIMLDPATCPAGAMSQFDPCTRRNYRIAT